MKTKTREAHNRDPSVLSDLGAIAGLYWTVFWMMGQRLQHGPHWEEHFHHQTLRVDERPRGPARHI